MKICLHTNTSVAYQQCTWRTLLGGAALVALVLAGCSKPEKELTLFQDVTPSSGLGGYTGMTFGAAWGDYDGDGLPDLYVTNHLNEARLYHNLGHGRFEDVTTKMFDHKDILADKHGAAWADFDNDGRQDLVQLNGAVKGVGVEPKQLFRNLGNHFVEVAGAMGVDNPEGRTRMPLWFDFNRDGWLDLYQGAEARLDDKTAPFVFMHKGEQFAASNEVLHLAGRSAPFCIATRLTSDDHPELVCRIIDKNHASQVFDIANLPARELALLPQTAFEDIAAADFDNDGQIDLFLTRKNPPGAVAFGQPAENDILADVWIDKANVDKPVGLSLRSKGKLKLRIASLSPEGAVTPQQIFLGQQAANPKGMDFELTPEIGAMAPHVPGDRAAVYIGFSAPDKWEIHVTAPRAAIQGSKHGAQQIQLNIVSSAAITKLEAVGEPAKHEEAPARLFMNRDGKLVEEGDKRGVNARLVAGANVVAGDFDNDMHVDLFVVASGTIGKQENLLLLNRGDGHFDVVHAAGGAAGDHLGVGDSVTAVDYDGDGFLDLLVASGASMGRSLGLPSERGSYHLYHNLGNGNHWIEMDLAGTASNRDGIGAVVRVTAGGVTQVRVQDGGLHYSGQNYQRLHFGLAKNAVIDKVSVHWPSGVVQELTNVKADQIMRIREPGSAKQATAR